MYFNRVLIEYIDFTLNTFNFLEYSAGFFRSSKVYNKLGQHNYETKDPDNIKEYFGDSRFGTYIYVGQVKEGTDEREGVGICVSQNGCIQEGEWKDDMLHGYGRTTELLMFKCTQCKFIL